MEPERTSRTLYLFGNANVGKSVIFSELTGKYVAISNYPGTTVEISRGKSESFEVIDTPGVSGVIPRSEDEKITFELISKAKSGDVLVHVSDAKNLKRSLLLTLTFAEAGLPMVLDLNMIDEAEKRGYEIDSQKLSQILGIPVVKTVAIESRGIKELKEAIQNATVPQIKIPYDPKIESAAAKISDLLREVYGDRARFVALTLLSANLSLTDELLKDLDVSLRRKVKECILDAQSQLSEPLSLLVIQAKNDVVERIYREAVRRKSEWKVRTFLHTMDDPAFHPIFGYLILVAVLYLMYQFVGVFAAGTLVDFIENVVFGTYILPVLKALVAQIPVPLLQDLLVGDYGLISMGLTYAVAIVFPIVTCFFLLFSLLEDSGYLPRLGVLLNRSFERLGLTGKAVVPLVLGLGCGTMAVIVTRVLETRRERILATLLLALGIPCSAQLGVIMGFFGVLGIKAFVLFVLIVALQLVLVGYLASKVIPGKKSAFLAELPPYRIPRAKNVFLKTYHRAKWFVKEALPLFIIGTLILFIADRSGVLPLFTNLVSPLIKGWLQLPEKTAESFILGFLRRDYGTAGLYVLFEKGLMDRLQAFVSMVVITLFVPCLANLLVMIKERGAKTAAAIAAFVFFYAFLAGGMVNFLLRFLNITFD